MSIQVDREQRLSRGPMTKQRREIRLGTMQEAIKYAIQKKTVTVIYTTGTGPLWTGIMADTLPRHDSRLPYRMHRKR